MPRLLFPVLGALLLIMATGVGRAQAPSGDPAQLKAFLQTPVYREMVGKAFASIPPPVFDRCSALKVAPSRVTILRPLRFAANGHPSEGAWRQSVPVSGCGNDTTLNLFFAANGERGMNALVGLPGSTHADPRLERYARGIATSAAVVAAKGCTAFLVTNTRFEAFGVRSPAIPDPGQERRLRPWWETWTMAGCGRTFEVPMDFMPDATGTKIVQPGGVVERHG